MRTGSCGRPLLWLTPPILSLLWFRPALLLAAIPLLAALVPSLRFPAARGGILLCALLSLGMITVPAVLMALYNNGVFGAWWRSGYHFWSPVPYEVPGLTFSLRYIPDTIPELLMRSRLLALILAAVLLRRTTPHTAEGKVFFEFAMLFALLLTAFHARYFVAASRFILPATTVLAVYVGAQFSSLLSRAGALCLPLLFLASVLVFDVPQKLNSLRETPPRTVLVQTVLEKAAPRALLIASVDPVYLGQFLSPRPDVEILPVLRKVEYASKLILPRTASVPGTPEGPYQHRYPPLRTLGAFDPVAEVVLENPGRIEQALRSGRQVLLDVAFGANDDVLQLEKVFASRPFGPGVEELKLKE